MSENEPTSTAKAEQQTEKAPTDEAEITRVNSKDSIHADPKPKEEEAEVDAEILAEESNYYLSGKRLWLVHTGILL